MDALGDSACSALIAAMPASLHCAVGVLCILWPVHAVFDTPLSSAATIRGVMTGLTAPIAQIPVFAVLNPWSSSARAEAEAVQNAQEQCRVCNGRRALASVLPMCGALWRSGVGFGATGRWPRSRGEGSASTSVALDFSGGDAPTAAIRGTVVSRSRLDNLHSQDEGKLERVDAADLDASWAIDMRALFEAAQAALAPMRTWR